MPRIPPPAARTPRAFAVVASTQKDSCTDTGCDAATTVPMQGQFCRTLCWIRYSGGLARRIASSITGCGSGPSGLANGGPWRAKCRNARLAGRPRRLWHASCLISSRDGACAELERMKTRAAVAWEAGAPLRIERVDLAGPEAGEVMVRMVATSVSQTDAFTLSGADPDGLFPMILGHEGARHRRGNRRRRE